MSYIVDGQEMDTRRHIETNILQLDQTNRILVVGPLYRVARTTGYSHIHAVHFNSTARRPSPVRRLIIYAWTTVNVRLVPVPLTCYVRYPWQRDEFSCCCSSGGTPRPTPWNSKLSSWRIRDRHIIVQLHNLFRRQVPLLPVS